MRKIILLIFGLFCAAGMDAAAQDVITRRNGEDIKAVIVEVTDDAIKYKRENLPDGPLFTISKADVLMVTYSDGSRDVFADYMPGGQAPAPAAYAEAPANLRPGMKYRELLQYYDYRNYRNFMGYERFSPAVAGLCSFIPPGSRAEALAISAALRHAMLPLCCPASRRQEPVPRITRRRWHLYPA